VASPYASKNAERDTLSSINKDWSGINDNTICKDHLLKVPEKKMSPTAISSGLIN